MRPDFRLLSSFLLVFLGGCGGPQGEAPSPDRGVVADGAVDAPPLPDLGRATDGSVVPPPDAGESGDGKMLLLLAGGLGGPGSADDVGTAARFNAPAGVVGDGAGKLYVADTKNCTIRTLAIATGAVTTLAGAAGQCGAADGAGASARFAGPHGLAADGAGNLYVADSDNHTIRKVEIATGMVTTLAGAAGQAGVADGVGAAARFNTPLGLAGDGAGNLFVTAADTVRKLVIATREVTTVAGAPGLAGSADGIGGAARFDTPRGIASDGAGTLYVADSNNHTLRKVDLATGTVGTFAGAAGQGDTLDGTGAAARFFYPASLVSDGNGNLWVAEDSSYTVRQVVIATRKVTTIAGTAGQMGNVDAAGAAARFGSPTAIATDGSGDLFVADSFNDTIRRMAIATAAVTTGAGAAPQPGSTDGTGAAARFDAPNAIAGDGAGNLYLADNRGTIRQLVMATGAVTTLAGSPSEYSDTDGIGAAAHFSRPTGLWVDGGDLYVTEFEGCAIRKLVLATATVTTVAGAPGMFGDVDGPGDLARFSPLSGATGDGAGNLFVTDTVNGAIRQMVMATGVVSTIAGGLGSPAGIASDGAGNLYVVERGTQTIARVVIATGAVSRVAGSAGQSGNADGVGPAARFHDPQGIASDGAGQLYVTDMNNHALRLLTASDGTVTTWAGVPSVARVHLGPLPAGLAFPTAIAIAGDMILLSDENSILAIR